MRLWQRLLEHEGIAAYAGEQMVSYAELAQLRRAGAAGSTTRQGLPERASADLPALCDLNSPPALLPVGPA